MEYSSQLLQAFLTTIVKLEVNLDLVCSIYKELSDYPSCQCVHAPPIRIHCIGGHMTASIQTMLNMI